MAKFGIKNMKRTNPKKEWWILPMNECSSLWMKVWKHRWKHGTSLSSIPARSQSILFISKYKIRSLPYQPTILIRESRLLHHLQPLRPRCWSLFPSILHRETSIVPRSRWFAIYDEVSVSNHFVHKGNTYLGNKLLASFTQFNLLRLDFKLAFLVDLLGSIYKIKSSHPGHSLKNEFSRHFAV